MNTDPMKSLLALTLAGLVVQLAACGSGAEDDDSSPAGDDDASEAATETPSSSSPTPTSSPSPTPTSRTPVPMAEAVFVAHDVVKDAQGTITQQGVIVGYDVATGEQIGEQISNVETPYGMQSLQDGTVLVNLSNRNEILIFDGTTMTELSRVPSSGVSGTRPVDSLISPEHDGQAYWLSLNDGSSGNSASNTALFIDINPASEDYLKAVGEIQIGLGHHQAGFSATRERVAVSNFSDCNNVVGVYDYSDPSNIKTLETLTAVEMGYDNSTKDKTCDTTESEGVSIKPHGCATSLASGKVYCNTTTGGKLIIVDIDAATPAFEVLQMSGTGGGYVKEGKGGEYMYTVQSTPREGNGGANCRIGQLVTVDASTDTIASTVPMFYKGPDCTDVLTGTDESASQGNHLKLSLDGEILFVALAPSFGSTGAHVRQQVVYDLSDPANPVQLDSIPVGSSSVQRGTAITGDGKYHYVTNIDDGTVTEIDVAALKVTRTLPAETYPKMVSTFGTEEGPSLPVGPVH